MAYILWWRCELAQKLVLKVFFSCFHFSNKTFDRNKLPFFRAAVLLLIWLWVSFGGKGNMEDGSGRPFFWKYVFKEVFYCPPPVTWFVFDIDSWVFFLFSLWSWLRQFISCSESLSQEWCNFSGKMFFPPSFFKGTWTQQYLDVLCSHGPDFCRSFSRSLWHNLCIFASFWYYHLSSFADWGTHAFSGRFILSFRAALDPGRRPAEGPAMSWKHASKLLCFFPWIHHLSAWTDHLHICDNPILNLHQRFTDEGTLDFQLTVASETYPLLPPAPFGPKCVLWKCPWAGVPPGSRGAVLQLTLYPDPP